MTRIVLGRIAAPPLVRSWIDKAGTMIPLVLDAFLSTSSPPRPHLASHYMPPTYQRDHE